MFSMVSRLGDNPPWRAINLELMIQAIGR